MPDMTEQYPNQDPNTGEGDSISISSDNGKVKEKKDKKYRKAKLDKLASFARKVIRSA